MQANKATAKKITLTIPTYAEAPYETLPMFAETRNHQGTSGDPFPNAVTSAPCSEKAEDAVYDAVMLENSWLQIIVVPALGGRIFAAVDKRNGYNFFYRQHVVKPALIGDLGSWISGGVEFNWPFHHRPATYMPTDWTVEEGEDGSATVWVSDIDPFYHMKGKCAVMCAWFLQVLCSLCGILVGSRSVCCPVVCLQIILVGILCLLQE